MHLAAGATPYQAACALLDGAERRNRTTVLAREIVLSASASFFRPGREEHGGEFLPSRAKEWAAAALDWARRTWPDQLASFVLHADEQVIHAHCICVPRERKPGGGWKLNSKKFFDREQLRALQTSYGEAMQPLGIKRGEPGSKATHSEARQFYGTIQRAREMRANRPIAPKPPKRPEARKSALASVLEPLARTVGIETTASRERELYAARRREWVERMKQYREEEERRMRELEALAVFQPLSARSTRAFPRLPSAPPHRPKKPADARTKPPKLR